MAAEASDRLRHFRLLLWNRWMEFLETWQEARFQRPLPSLCFSGRSEKQDGCPGLWLAETFWTSSLKPLKGIQRNLTGSKISTSSTSTKFVFFRKMSEKKCSPSCSAKKVAHCTQVHDMWPFGPLVYVVTLTLKVDLLLKKLFWNMTFESEGLLIVAIYIWLSPGSYVVFLTTLVLTFYALISGFQRRVCFEVFFSERLASDVFSEHCTWNCFCAWLILRTSSEHRYH